MTPSRDSTDPTPDPRIEITDEMVERGTRASWHGPPAYDDLPPSIRDGRRQMVRNILAAALNALGPMVPLARAQALETIYTDALQRIVDDDPDLVDAQRIAAKALGDANEYRNTGKVRWESPLARAQEREDKLFDEIQAASVQRARLEARAQELEQEVGWLKARAESAEALMRDAMDLLESGFLPDTAQDTKPDSRPTS